MPFLSQMRDGRPLLAIFVQPRSSRNTFVAIHDQAVKLAITAPPVDNKANGAVIAFLADFFHLPKREIRITGGQQSRRKQVVIGELSEAEIRGKIMAALAADPGKEEKP